MSVEVPLTKGRVALIDDADLVLVAPYTWHAHESKDGKWYARTAFTVEGKLRRIYMHRLLLNAPKGVFVDHEDGNGLNNKRSNIRLCNQSRNSANARKTRRPTSSRFKGVTWSKSRKLWIAYIGELKRLTLGAFADEIEAARAYDTAAVEIYGEFAKLNFPNDGGQVKPRS